MFEHDPPPSVSLITRPKLAGPGEHYGVLFTRVANWFDRSPMSDGLVRVVYDLNTAGPRELSMDEFAEGHQVQVRAYYTDPDVVEAAHHRLNEGCRGHRARFDLGQRNCEHWARWVVTGEERSSQIAGLGFVGAIVLLAAALG
jgi:hypothetical protein